MSRRISTLFKRKEPERTQNSSSDNFLSANNDNAQYSTFNSNNNQTPYSSNTAAYNNNGFQAVPANRDSPYRAMPATMQANSSEPRLMNQPLPYPPTPQLHHPSLQTNLNTNIGNNYTVRNRPPSSSSPSPSYGSNPSDFSVISSARDPSPRQRNVSSPDSLYRPTSGQTGTSYQYRKASELPVPGNVPHMSVGTRRSLQDVQSSQGPYPNERQHAPFRAPPPAAPPSVPRQTPATRDYHATEDLANPPSYQPQQHQPEQHPLRNTIDSDQLRQQRQHSSSKNYIRQLRHHIREKYRLDVLVWSERNVLPADRPLIQDHCIKADAAMQQIMNIILYWEEDLFDPEEWRIAKKIKESILKHPKQHQSWEECLPWDRKEEPDVPAVDDVTAKMAETTLER